ncbi:MAG: RNA polymerase sigma factor [Halioglobus sp.]|nr:RNA polymerase sigma factor [Halioglobus sp.]
MPPLLEELKALHNDSFGWSLACCAWHRDLAEDVLQEAYLRVLDGRADFNEKSTIKTWFFAVIRRVAADMQRTHKRRSILNLRVVADTLASVQGSVGHTNPMIDTLYEGETSQQLQRALLQLPQRQREVLHLVFYSGFTVEEAAATAQITVGSARTHYHRGKERLLQLLTENDENE